MTQASGEKPSSKLGPVIFLIIGVFALGFAGWQAWRTAAFLRTAVHVQGAVAPDSPGSTETMTEAHPTISFKTRDGRVVRYAQNGMGGRRVGTAVTVLYDPADPQNTATAGGFWVLWGGALLPLAMGLGFVVLPLLGAEIGVRPGRY